LNGEPYRFYISSVVLSGSDLSEDVNRAQKLGADDYRVKTSNLNRLTEMLHELQACWLNGHRKGMPDMDAASSQSQAGVQSSKFKV